MDDGKGLDLSLGLPCSGSSSSSKEKSGNSTDAKNDTDEKTNKILNDFKNFLNAGGISQPFQRIDSVKSLATSGDKRKGTFDETADQKRHETETRSSDLQDKAKSTHSHISITTDEGSTADNEDVADSEADGSSSRAASRCDDDGSKTTPAGGGARFGGGGASVPFSITFESPPVSTSSTSYQILSAVRSVPATNVPMSFRYSSRQLVAHPQAIQSPYAVRPPSTSVPTQVTTPTPSEPVHSSDQSKGQTKQAVPEEGSSSHSEDNTTTTTNRPNTFPSEYPSIRPGITAEVKFGGSGSFPNLPWVSTTGPGPNGRTISGVTYKYNATQIKIVCACHGVHLSPDEFVRHAAEEQPSVPATPVLASVPSSNPAASAKS